MFFELFEIVVNIIEPVLLFILLKSKLPIKRKALPFAAAGIIVLAAAMTAVNKLEIDYVATILIVLVNFCLYSILVFSGDIRLRLVWASMMIYILSFSNTVLTAATYAVSDSTLIAALQPSVLRLVAQVIYIVIDALMVLLVIRTTRSIGQVTSKAAMGMLASCIICITAMYFLLEVTISAGLSILPSQSVLLFQP